MKLLFFRFLKRLRNIFSTRLAAGVITILFVFSLIYLTKSGFFNIKGVACKTQYGPCISDDLDKIEDFRGQNLFLTKTSSVQSLFSPDFLNRKITVQKVFPSTLVVILEKRKAIVALKVKDSPGAFVLDRDGMVVDHVEQTSLPELVLSKSPVGLAKGELADKRIRTGVKIMQAVFRLQDTGLALLEEDSLKVELEEGVEAIFPLEGDEQVLVGALQLIIKRSRMMEKLPKEIDLRYSNPVLRY